MDASMRGAEFDDTFAARYERALRLAYAILGDLPLAEDAAAEALIRTRTRWNRIRGLRHREAWVLRAVATIAIDAARRRRGAQTPSVGTTDGKDLVALDPALVDRLVRLPARQRVAVVLVDLAGCPPADAAAAMDLSLVAVQGQRQRGLDRLEEEVPGFAAGSWRSVRAIHR